MNSTPAMIVARALVVGGLGTDPTGTPAAWQIFYHKEPVDPDETITVFNDPSLSIGKDMRGRSANVYYGVKVQIRSRVHSVGFKKGIDIREFLKSVAKLEVIIPGDGTPYTLQNYSLINDVQFLMEQEKNRRQVFFINGRATILE